MPRHVGTLKVVITMSQLRWTEFSLTICRGAKRRSRRKRRTWKMAGARLSLRGQFVEKGGHIRG